MTIQDESRRSPGLLLLGYLFAVVLGAVLLGAFLHRATSGFAERMVTLITGRRDHFEVTAPIVVEKIQALNRLETVIYSLDTIVENSTSSPVFPDVLAGDKILLIVHGQAIAGIDLAKLKPEDVHIDGPNGRSIHINLPSSEIFLVSLNDARTRVYARSTGLLIPADQNLESDARAKAVKQLHENALSDGILDVARKNARVSITLMLSGLGFDHVEVS